MKKRKIVILGIDPGLATTGFGVVRFGKKTKCLSYGLIKTEPFLDSGERLKKIQRELQKILKKYQPDFVAIENVYFFKNIKTAIPVSEAKGVIILTCSKKRIPIHEFTPLQIKMAIVGYGRAEKKQVQRMIKEILNLKEVPKEDDAADALGACICCFRKIKTNKLLWKE